MGAGITMSSLKKLTRRLHSAETYTLCCEASRDIVSAEIARSDCELIEQEASAIYAEIFIMEPGSENAKMAKNIADQITSGILITASK